MSAVQKMFSGKKSSHAELSLAIHQEKCVQSALKKLLDAKKEAAEAWLNYANSEKCEPVKVLFQQMNKVDQYNAMVYQDYLEQSEGYGSHFQFILQGERAIDDLQKTVDDYTPKINKIQKQLDSLGAKGRDRKYEALSVEKGKLLSQQQKAQKELDDRRENHILFKYKNIRDAVRLVTDTYIKLHERCFEIFQTQRLLCDYFTATTYSALTPDALKQASSNSEKLLEELERKLQFNPDGAPAEPSAPSQEILDELADIFGNPHQPNEFTECEATYNPVPDLDPGLVIAPRKNSKKGSGNRTSRPLPPVPPTEYGNVKTPQTEYTSALYMDPQPEMLSASQIIKQSTPVISSDGPPIPPRKDIMRKGSKGSGKGSKHGESPKAEMEPQYLDMDAGSGGMRVNSIYDGGPSEPANRSSYLLLSQAYAGKRNNSSKSIGSASSHSDSGMESRGSVKSNASQLDEEEEEVYEIMDSRFPVRKKPIDENVYEIENP